MSKFTEYRRVSQNKSSGEVFTPVELAREMISKIPKEIFISDSKTFLVPGFGEGVFIKELVWTLVNGYGHPLDNALSRVYGVDVRVKYVNLLKPYGYKVYQLDFLSEEFDKKFENMKFDVVVGNPPYNGLQNAKGKRGGGHNIWTDFTIKSINELLVDGGYLVFVHPTLWRKPQSEHSSSRKVSELMFSKQIHYLEMHDVEDGKKTFGAGTRYDWYILQNSDVYKDTVVDDEKRNQFNLNLKNYKLLPNFDFDVFNSILAKNDDSKCEVIFDVSNYETRNNWVSFEKTNEYKYPLVHSTPKSGTRIAYSSKNDKGHFGIPKVIFGDSGINDVIIDMNGEYGMTQHAMGIKVDSLEDAENIKRVLLSDKFSEFLKSVMWSNFQIDWRMFNYFKKDFWREFV